VEHCLIVNEAVFAFYTGKALEPTPPIIGVINGKAFDEVDIS